MSKLRAVRPDEHPATPLSVSDAAKTGDRALLLTAMRDHIAEAITSGCAPRDLAALTKRLADIDRELRAIQEAEAQARAAECATTDDAYDPEAV